MSPIKGTQSPRPTVPGSEDLPGYEDVTQVGHDATGAVFTARHVTSGRAVRIRVTSGQQLDAATRAGFAQDQRRLMGLTTHPGLLTVLDAGTANSGDLYAVLDSPQGGTLVAHLAEEGVLPPERAVELGSALARAVTSLHEAGLVHGRVEPGNVFLSPTGDVELGDAASPGTARLPDLDDDADAVLLHTAPEVLAGGDATEASDVYSLGALVFTALRGRPPFADDDGPLAAVARASTEPAPNLRLFGVPNDVCAALEHALAKDPALRPATAAAFARELRGEETPEPTLVPAQPVETVPPVPRVTRAEAVAAAPPSPPAGSPPPVATARARRRSLLVAAVAAAAVVLAGAAFVAVALLSPDQPRRASRDEPASAKAAPGTDTAEKSGPPPASEFTTVTDETGTFQARVPAAWTALFKRTDGGTSRILKAAPDMGSFLDFEGPGVVFKVTDFQEGSEDAQNRLMHIERESMVHSAGCADAILSLPDAPPDRVDVMAERWTGCPNGGEELDYAYTAEVGGKRYVVGVSARVFSEADAEAFDEVVGSVKISPS